MPDERFHIYAVPPIGRRDNAPRLLATTDRDGIGTALVTLADEGEFEGSRIGVLERSPEEERGRWIINPYGPNSAPAMRRAGSLGVTS